MAYVTVNWNTTKTLKAAQAAYENAYQAMKEADKNRKALKALEMTRAGLIPVGTEPVWKTRPWDGVVQAVADDDGTLHHQVPKTTKAVREERTI